MLPNGSDVHPAKCFGAAWPPTVVEDGLQLTAASAEVADDRNAERFAKRRGAVNDGGASSELGAMKFTFMDGALQLEDAGIVEPGAVLPSTKTCSNSGPPPLEFNHSAAGFLYLGGAKLRSGLQLADPESRRLTNAGPSPKDCGAAISAEDDEGGLADLNSLGAVLGKVTGGCSPVGAESSPSPPTARSPPSYGEALLHKALRGRADLTDVLATYRALGGPSAAAHLPVTSPMTRDDDATVPPPPEVAAAGGAARSSEVVCHRPPPPPYQLRPRQQNHSRDTDCRPRTTRSTCNGNADQGRI